MQLLGPLPACYCCSVIFNSCSAHFCIRMLSPKNVETITVWITAVPTMTTCTVRLSLRLKDFFRKIAANHIWSLNCLVLKFHQNTGRDQNNLIIARKRTWRLFASMNRPRWLVVWHLQEGKVSTNHSQHNDFVVILAFRLRSDGRELCIRHCSAHIKCGSSWIMQKARAYSEHHTQLQHNLILVVTSVKRNVERKNTHTNTSMHTVLCADYLSKAQMEIRPLHNRCTTSARYIYSKPEKQTEAGTGGFLQPRSALMSAVNYLCVFICFWCSVAGFVNKEHWLYANVLPVGGGWDVFSWHKAYNYELAFWFRTAMRVRWGIQASLAPAVLQLVNYFIYC